MHSGTFSAYLLLSRSQTCCGTNFDFSFALSIVSRGWNQSISRKKLALRELHNLEDKYLIKLSQVKVSVRVYQFFSASTYLLSVVFKIEDRSVCRQQFTEQSDVILKDRSKRFSCKPRKVHFSTFLKPRPRPDGCSTVLH